MLKKYVFFEVQNTIFACSLFSRAHVEAGKSPVDYIPNWIRVLILEENCHDLNSLLCITNSFLIFDLAELWVCENLTATLFLLSKQKTNKVLNCVKNWRRWALPDNLISYYFLYITQNMLTLIGSPLSSAWLEARLGSPRYGLIRGWARLDTALFGARLEALFSARFGSARLWLGAWLGRG